MTELRLLAGLFGIESIIKKDPDIIFTVADAKLAQAGLTGAPGAFSVIDEKTVYLRMPPSFMTPETVLMALKISSNPLGKNAQPPRPRRRHRPIAKL